MCIKGNRLLRKGILGFGKWRQLINRFIFISCAGIFALMLNQGILESITALKPAHLRHKRILVKRPELDLTRENVTLWPNDTLCSKFETYFARDLEPTYLVSFPRSGNSWTRYLIEASTGIFSGSVYNDERMKNMGFHGELEPHTSRTTIVTKTHAEAIQETPPVPLRGKARVILLIRNPAEAIPSHFSLKMMKDDKKAHFLTVDEKKHETKEFRIFVREILPKWSQVVESILVWTKHLLVIFYEDLVDDPLAQVHRMIDFLEFPVDPERLRCLANHINGPAKRNHRKIDPFTHSEKKHIAHAMADVMGLLKLRNIRFPRSYIDWINPLRTQINNGLAS